MLRRNDPVVKSVESVLRLEGSLWRERFVEEVGNGRGALKLCTIGRISNSCTGCYYNIAPNAKCERVLVLAVCLACPRTATDVEESGSLNCWYPP